MHQGGLKLWAVYMTIGNLDKKTRMSQLRPSYLLLGLIPIVEGGKEYQKLLQHH